MSQFQFTCLACQVAFQTALLQRDHYKGDWHRFNLKRRAVKLPPLTAEDFAVKVTEQQQQQQQEQKKQEETTYCKACNKSFQSDGSFQQHLLSKRHKQLVVATGEIIVKRRPIATHDLDTANYIDANTATEEEIQKLIEERVASAPRLTEQDCLFCQVKSDTLQQNLDHMSNKHCFFIPDVEFLVDLKGLLSYLGEKLSLENECLYCHCTNIHSLPALRQHMLDKGHAKIAYDHDNDILELSDFYDFSSSYPPNAAEPEEEEGLGETEFELVLPNGNRIGHRALLRYYKQRHPVMDRDEALLKRLALENATNEAAKVAASSRALILGNNSFLRSLVCGHRELREKYGYGCDIGMRSNKLQRHFRSQVPL